DASGNATLYFDAVDYDPAPIQLATPIQDPNKSEQTLVIASLSGDLGTRLNATSQQGAGTLYREDEVLASFQPSLGSGCLIQRAVSNQNFRIVSNHLLNFLKDRHGYIKFNLSSPAVGLILSKQGPSGQQQNRFAGIRSLHKTLQATSTLSLPVFPPFCQ
ncbi:MAG TPA: hypothetical protein VEF04_14530, partial [Blastocatellia bacterium]|nr:hypothetical protein [Blastocatellia bacterium]